MYSGFVIVGRPQGDFELLGIRSGMFGTFHQHIAYFPTRESAEASMQAMLAPAPNTTTQYDATGKKL